MLDPEATTVSFTLGATLHEVHGSARLARGEIRLDGETGLLTGEVVIDATSADTDNEGRDRDMHLKVLESSTFPEIVWRPHEVEGVLNPGGEATVEVRGSISIHGAEHEISFPVELSLAGEHWSATAAFTIPYVEWGMKDPSKFVLRVEKVVEVEIQAGGSLLAAAPDTATVD